MFEAHNLTGQEYREVQEFSNGERLDINTYDLGQSFSLGASLKF